MYSPAFPSEPLPTPLTSAALSELDLVALEIVERVTGLIGCERTALFLPDEAGDLVSRYAQGSWVVIRVAKGRGVVGWVAEHRRPVRLADPYDDPRFERLWDQATGTRTHSYLAVPLENPMGDLVGVLACANRDGGFDEIHEGVLKSVAALASLRIDHLRVLRRRPQSGQNRSASPPSAPPRVATPTVPLLQGLEQALEHAQDARAAIEIVLARLREEFDLAAAVGLLAGLDPIFLIDRPVEVTQRRVRAELASATLDRLETNFAEPPGLLGKAAPQGARIIRTRIEVDGEHVGILELYCRADAPPDLRQVGLAARELGRALEQLRRPLPEEPPVAQTIGTFVHDLRLPLSAAVGYSDLLVEEEDPEERTHCVRQIRAALKDIEQMSRDVLEFVRGRIELAVEDVEVRAFLASVADQLEPDLTRHAASLYLQGEREGRMRLDPGRIRRALSNLAMNSVQAGAHEVRIRVEREPAAVVFWIEDDGQGIPPEVAARLFQPFATHGKKGGTGLGLASARRVAEAHGGTLELVSTSKAGTVFRLRLPQ